MSISTLNFKEESKVKLNKDLIIIENNYLRRVFQLDNGVLQTKEIFNKLSNSYFRPQENSEEFVISLLGDSSEEIKTSNLKFKDYSIIENNDKKVMEFEFHEYLLEDNTWNISMILEMEKKAHYMKKYLKINCSNEDIIINHIDLEHLYINEHKDFSWSRPLSSDFNTTAFYLGLGQPVYVNSLFLGCEFPGTHNEINENNLIHLRYYSGKSLKELKKDNKFIKTWKTVLGSARSHDIEVLKADFFKYIKDISQPSRFRIQFNSWYDHMYDITSDNIEKSFKAMEKGLSKYGVRPLDSYVIDDGWVSYKEGFWEFIEDKFNDGFHKESKLTKKLYSNFGVWVGPRGGYSQAYEYADVLKEMGYGKNTTSQDICTGDYKYIRDLTDRMIEFMKKYNVNYWKIDGFCLRDCRSENHGHAIGGHEGMNFYTDHWEEWIEAFKRMREVNKKVFINITSYAFPSPWFLQWVDAVWMNNAADMGFLGEGDSVDQMLTYRDGRYYDFLFTRQWQFPLGYLYNHEPCYANKNTNLLTGETVRFTSEEFKKYLYMCLCRGTGFVELYYSPEIMDDEKWRINADALKWAEEHFYILEKGKMIGGNPEKGEVYGYSAWHKDEGIIALRNPSNDYKTFTLILDKHIGATEEITGVTRKYIYPHSSMEYKLYRYGEEIEVELEPYEVVVWQFS